MLTPTIHTRISGFSMIEVLVSVIVLAVGLLGLAALQISMIRYNNSAQMRSIAIAQATDMLDRMRSNYAGITSGYYNNISGTPSNPNCTTCSSQEIAQSDTYQWNSANQDLLPSGQGTVVGVGNLYTVTVYWDNTHSGALGTGCSGNAAVDLTCLQIQVQL